MGLFEEVSRFLEDRLDQFMKEHPELELQMLLDQLEEQQRESLKLIGDLQQKQQQTQGEIRAIADEIKLWQGRIKKVSDAGEEELANKARLKQESLFAQGNTLWGQMEAYKQQINQIQNLMLQIQARIEEVKSQSPSPAPSSPTPPKQDPDSIDKIFERWELDEELRNLKRD